MIFESEYHVEIPSIDLLSFLFSRTPFQDNDPIWINPSNPANHVTLAKARDLTHRIGQGYRDLGVGAEEAGKDIVLTYVENQVMVAPNTLGVLCAGGVHATCSVTATAFELARQIRLSGPKVLICSPRTRKAAEEAITQSNTDVRLVMMVSDSVDIVDTDDGKSIIGDRKLDWQRFTDPKVLQRTTACLVYSSGTTGVPKGVVTTHANIVANLCQMAFFFDHFAQKAIREGVYLRMPGVMQNAVAVGIYVQTMLALQCGMQVYMFPKYDFSSLMASIKKYQLSACFIVPAIWNRILQECTREDVASIRFAMSGASPLPLPLQLKVHDMLPDGVVLRVNWGMTETVTAASQPNVTEVDREGSSGRLLPNMQAVIMSPSGEKLGYDEPGELCIRGPNIIKEYFDNPEATRAAYTADGWFRTGDVAHFDRNGKLYIVGRSKELLKYKSFQVSPTEVESVLGQLPGIVDVGVIGVPDGQGNDLPRAYVVRSDKPPRLEEKDIHDFLNPRVSHYKRLRGSVRFVDEIPRNLNQKIMRDVLKQWVEREEGRKDNFKARL
ncbi:putative acyl-coenzyme A synthetase [Cladophialophora carrionii]|uniref:Putative acyl-coenzyme A synthetase n=1 Tax=Cladophialophora carrionii TaxID=86049 RepID=A0A1C1CXC5_9EURO|nr:putative acyl-coenzyme A synthetase [Cladophialophora carrionii]